MLVLAKTSTDASFDQNKNQINMVVVAVVVVIVVVVATALMFVAMVINLFQNAKILGGEKRSPTTLDFTLY